MSYRHAAVWIDHKEARIFRVEATSFDAAELPAPTHHVHKHPRGAEEPTEHTADAKHFFESVVKGLEGAAEILILGPSTAKAQFVKWIGEHAPALTPRIVGVETVDHPTDRQIAAYARKYFKAADRIHHPPS